MLSPQHGNGLFYPSSKAREFGERPVLFLVFYASYPYLTHLQQMAFFFLAPPDMLQSTEEEGEENERECEE